MPERLIFVLVRGQIIQDDDGAGRDFLDENFSDVGGKCRCVHYAIDDPWRDQGIPDQPLRIRFKPKRYKRPE